jgi:toxin ParE1/3/4
MQVRWHEDAVGDLVALRRYIALENPAAAQRVARKLLERVNLLRKHPMLGKAGRIESTRELVVAGTPYTIVYLPQSDVITFLGVFHQAQQW